MTQKKNKFEACLLRITTNEFVVAEWDQLITTADKTKLVVGSSVGYRRSTNKREKPIKGTIMVIGSVKLCQQQMKLFTNKSNKKKIQVTEADNSEEEAEEESAGGADDKDTSDSDNEQSSESNDECLHIDTQEEIQNVHGSKRTQSEELQVVDRRQNARTTNFDEAISNSGDDNDDSECTTNSSSFKRTSSDAEIKSPASKRSMLSLAHMEEIKMENVRLKNQVDKFKKEWMPRPTHPAVIDHIILMGNLFSPNGDNEEKKEDRLTAICTLLHLTKEQLVRLKKHNGTKTARAIVRTCYPASVRPSVKLEDIGDDFRTAVQDYVQMFHGMEALTEGKINESINNVFRSAKNRQKGKDSKQQALQSTVNTSQQPLQPITNISQQPLQSTVNTSQRSSQSTVNTSQRSSQSNINSSQNLGKKKASNTRDKENVHANKKKKS